MSTSLTAEAGKVGALITKTDGHDTQLTSIEADTKNIKQSVSNITADYVKQSSVSVSADKVLIGSTAIDGDALSSVISVSPTAIDLISDKINVTGNVNIKGGVTALAVDAIEGNFARLFASSLTSNVIKSDHIQTDTALAKKLFATNANIDELITQTHFVNEMHALTLNVVDLNASNIRSKIITSNTIESDMLKVDLAMVSRIYSHSAFINNASIKAANITDLTATHVRGGLLESLNGSYSQNLITGNTHYYTNANINFHSRYNQLRMTNGTRIGGIYMRDEGLEKVKAHFGVSDGSYIDENSTSWAGMISDGETRSTLLSGNYIIFSANGYTRRYENASWRMDTASRGDGTNRYFYGNDSGKYNYILGHMNNKLSNIFTQYVGTSIDPVERLTTKHVNALRFTTINGYPAIIWGATGIQFRSNDGVYLISSTGTYISKI